MTTALDGPAVLQIERLAKEAAGMTTEIDGKRYSTTPLYDPRKAEPVPTVLTVHTLMGLCEYVRGTHDAAYVEKRKRFVHVVSPTLVHLHTDVFGEFNQRACLMASEAITPSFPFGQFQDPESFNIGLQAHFEPSTDRANVLSLVGGLKAEKVLTLEDDGVSQQATGRRGVAGAVNVKVPNPVLLRPYRTFAEVAQPESPFVLRLRGGGDDEFPKCALIEADGGKWRLTAIEHIKAWLKADLKDSCEVYG